VATRAGPGAGFHRYRSSSVAEPEREL
jgi:hypothetical protein